MAAGESPFEIEQWLAGLLTDDPDVIASVSGQVHPIFIPSSELLPALTYQRKQTARDMTHRGASGLAKPRFELACWAQSSIPGYKQNLITSRAVRLAINGWQGTKDAHNVRSVSIDDEYDEDDTPVFADGVVTFRRVLVVSIQHTEVVKNQIQPTN